MTLADAVDAITEALEPLTLEVPGLQVCGFFNPNPTPPSIDVYPADPFQDGAGYGVTEKRVFWNVRARVATADGEAASRLLLRLLDPSDPASVEAALADGDPAAVVGSDGAVSGFLRFTDDTVGDLLACQWRVEMFV
jgi:hypothetical protein